ncbi:MAG: SPOR domain-containing protein [Candidatus Acidiferrales bacterium]
MAGAKKGGRGDMVLEGRHLFGLFVLLAVLFGVVFTLGYLLGKGQGDSQAHIAAIRADDSVDTSATGDPSETAEAPTAANDKTPAAPAASSGTDWSFYHSADSKPANDTLQPAPSSKPTKTSKTAAPSPASASAPASNSKPSVPAAKSANKSPNSGRAAVGSPLIPKGAIVLQVAALEKQSDALAIAQALQQRKFPAFVLPAGPDKYYHVQVGPYATAQAAAAAQKKLESAGFKSIVKR